MGFFASSRVRGFACIFLPHSAIEIAAVYAGSGFSLLQLWNTPEVQLDIRACFVFLYTLLTPCAKYILKRCYAFLLLVLQGPLHACNLVQKPCTVNPDRVVNPCPPSVILFWHHMVLYWVAACCLFDLRHVQMNNTIVTSSFQNKTAKWGGVFGAAGESILNINGSQFRLNAATLCGGVEYIIGSAQVRLYSISWLIEGQTPRI